jgi:hypothetical protein
MSSIAGNYLNQGELNTPFVVFLMQSVCIKWLFVI